MNRIRDMLANLTEYFWNNDTNKSLNPCFKSLSHIRGGDTRSLIRRNRRTLMRSETWARAGVPETAKDDKRGIRETISLQSETSVQCLATAR